MSKWKEVKIGERIPFFQGYALNFLIRMFNPDKIEILESEEENIYYRITKKGKRAIYEDLGDKLKESKMRRGYIKIPKRMRQGKGHYYLDGVNDGITTPEIKEEKENKMRKVSQNSLEDLGNYLELDYIPTSAWVEDWENAENVSAGIGEEIIESLLVRWSDGNRILARECNENLDYLINNIIYEGK